MQLLLAPLIGASTRGGGEGARLYTAMAAVTVMFSPHREIKRYVLDHRLHARAAVLQRTVTCNDNHHHGSLLLRRGLGPQGRADPRVRSEAGHPLGEDLVLVISRRSFFYRRKNVLFVSSIRERSWSE